MNALFTHVAVTLAVAVPTTELAALYARMAYEVRCPKQCYTVVLQEWPRFDVGSHALERTNEHGLPPAFPHPFFTDL